MTPSGLFTILVVAFATFFIGLPLFDRWRSRSNRPINAEQALKGVAKAKEREARKRVAREWAMIMRMIRSTIRSGGTYINSYDLYPENEDRLRKLGYVVHNGLVSWDNVEKKG
jgi:hypothetical protein